MKIHTKLFLISLIFSFYFVQWYGWNEESHFALTRAIVEEGKFEIDSFHNQTGDRALYRNHYYSDKDPGLAILASPIHATWKSIYKFFPENFKEKFGKSKLFVTELHDSIPIIAFIDKGFFLSTSMILVTVFTSGIFTALTGILVFKISKKLTDKKSYRILIMITYLFGTLAFPYSLHFMNHAAATFFLFLSFFILFELENNKSKKTRGKKKTKKKGWMFFALSGLFLGISFFVDRLLIIFSPFFFFYSLSINKKKSLIFLFSLIFSVSPYLLYNYSIFQDAFQLTSTYLDTRIYKKALSFDSFKSPKSIQSFQSFQSSNSLEIVKSSIINLENLESLKIRELLKKFQIVAVSPNSAVIFRLLFYPYRGLFFYYPILLIAVIGLYFMLDDYERKSFLIFWMFFLLVSVVSMRRVWWGGYCFGPRYLLSIVPFLMIPLTYSIKKMGLKGVLAFLIISMFVNLLGLQPAEEGAYNWRRMEMKQTWIQKQDTYQILANPLVTHYWPLFIKNGPRSAIFEHLVNGYISIDPRFPPLSKGENFPFNEFHIPFLCLVPLIPVFISILLEGNFNLIKSILKKTREKLPLTLILEKISFQQI